MKVVLNGRVYQLTPGTGVSHEHIAEFPEHVRQQGQQQRSDRALMSSWQFNKFTYGQGIRRMDIDEDRDLESFWESTTDTRWNGQVLLPPMVMVPSFPTASYSHMGRMCFGITDVILASKKVGKWALLTFNDNGYFQWGMDLGANEIFPAVAYFDGDYHFYGANGSLTGFMVQAAATPTFQNMSIYHVTVQGVERLSDGYKVGNFLEYVGSLNLGVLTSNNRAFIHPFLSGTYESESPYYKKSRLGYVPWLEHTVDGIYAGNDEGIFQLDFEQRTWTEKLSLLNEWGAWNCRHWCNFDGTNLIFQYDTFSEVAGVGAYNTSDKAFARIGLDVDDGQPTGATSLVRCLLSTKDYIFAATNKSTYLGASHCQLWVYDRYGWHYFCEVPSGASVEELRMASWSFNKLWIVPTYCGTAGTSYGPYYVRSPIENPLQVPTYSFATQGRLVHPGFNAGMPEMDTTFLEYVIEADQLASGRKIDVYYGLNNAAPSTHLGTATLSGVRVLPFGDGLGVNARSIQMAEVLTRGSDQYMTPILITHHSPVINYMKVPDTREVFKVIIDIEKSAVGPSRLASTIADEIFDLRDIKTMVPFYYAHVPTKSVKLMSITSEEVGEVHSEGLPKELVSGYIEVVLAELL